MPALAAPRPDCDPTNTCRAWAAHPEFDTRRLRAFPLALIQPRLKWRDWLVRTSTRAVLDLPLRRSFCVESVNTANRITTPLVDSLRVGTPTERVAGLGGGSGSRRASHDPLRVGDGARLFDQG